MSDIEHHTERGGLDATLGDDEFGSPTSSGKQLKRLRECLSKWAATHPPRSAARAHDLEPPLRGGLVS
jgi:hypothetical protein